MCCAVSRNCFANISPSALCALLLLIPHQLSGSLPGLAKNEHAQWAAAPFLARGKRSHFGNIPRCLPLSLPRSLACLFWADRPPQTNEDFSPSANSSYLVLSPEVARNILRQRERQREGERDEFREGNNGLTVAGCSGNWLESGGGRSTGGRSRITGARGEICGCAFVSGPGTPPKRRNESGVASAKREMK